MWAPQRQVERGLFECEDRREQGELMGKEGMRHISGQW